MPFAAGRPDWKFWHKTIRAGTVPGGLCPLFLPEVIKLKKELAFFLNDRGTEDATGKTESRHERNRADDELGFGGGSAATENFILFRHPQPQIY